nr:hypothetical protein [Propionibacterium sp.]
MRRRRPVDPGRGERTRRPWLFLVVLGVTLALLGAAWVSVCVRYVANPRIDPREQVDALYVLGPLETRIEPALALMDAGVAPVMVATTSIDPAGRPYFTQYCGRTTETYRIECVLPDPNTTRGEARLVAALMRERGWTRVGVLASTPQAERARMLLERCVPGEVLVWDYPVDRSVKGWLAEFVHQSGGWVQAQLDPGC